jgi:stringent starvation protein B
LKARRPYLLRALHEWISDSGETPHIVVDAEADGVTVPRQYVKDGKIILNVSFTATQALKLGNDCVSFEARFGGVSMAVQVPVRAILGIYARETGQGMIFPEGDADDDDAKDASAKSKPARDKDQDKNQGKHKDNGRNKDSPAKSKRPNLHVVK